MGRKTQDMIGEGVMKALYQGVLMAGALVSVVTTTAVAKPVTGIYLVPVDKPELRPYAEFTVEDVRFGTRDDGTWELRYDLPPELTGGDPAAIELTGEGFVDGELVLTGPKGRSVCVEEPEARIKCTLTYNDLVLDQAAVAAWLAANRPAAELPARVEVARVFANDPIGIMTGLKLDQDGE